MANVLLIDYDNGSHLPFFPMNLFYLAGALKKAKHTVGIWLQDIHHGSEEALTKILDENPFDVVGLGFCAGYWQYEKAKRISEAVRVSKRRRGFKYILGGHGPAGCPEYSMEKFGADAVIVGDGEKAICEDPQGIVKGEPCNQDEAPLEIYEELFPIAIYRLIRWPNSKRHDFCFPILSSRGCKWHCSFCYRMREGFHERAIEAIIEEIKFLHYRHGITHFQFADELLMGSVRRTEDICQALLRLPFKIKWDCNGRLNFATQEILSLMKKAGAVYVNYGIESLSQSILNQMKKGLTVDQIHRGVMATLRGSLSPGLNFIWGFPGDTVENLFECVEFLKKYDPCHELRTIRPVTPYPGCPLWFEAIEKGLVKDAEDFYENKHKNSDLFAVNFMDIPTEEAHFQLQRANIELIKNYHIRRTIRESAVAKRLYGGDTDFRGFREV